MGSRKQVDHQAFESFHPVFQRVEIAAGGAVIAHRFGSFVWFGDLREPRVGGGGQTASVGEGDAL